MLSLICRNPSAQGEDYMLQVQSGFVFLFFISMRSIHTLEYVRRFRLMVQTL